MGFGQSFSNVVLGRQGELSPDLLNIFYLTRRYYSDRFAETIGASYEIDNRLDDSQYLFSESVDNEVWFDGMAYCSNV